MRNIRKNQQSLMYALYTGESPEYKKDSNGNLIIDGYDANNNPIYRETGQTVPTYDLPVEFKSSISFGGSEVDLAPYGISNADYDATLVLLDGEIPVTETSLIWYSSTPVINNGVVDSSSADFTVVKIVPSLNQKRYVLKKIVK